MPLHLFCHPLPLSQDGQWATLGAWLAAQGAYQQQQQPPEQVLPFAQPVPGGWQQAQQQAPLFARAPAGALESQLGWGPSGSWSLQAGTAAQLTPPPPAPGGLERTGSALGSGSGATLQQLQMLQLQRQGSFPQPPVQQPMQPPQGAGVAPVTSAPAPTGAEAATDAAPLAAVPQPGPLASRKRPAGHPHSPSLEAPGTAAPGRRHAPGQPVLLGEGYQVGV